MDDLLPQGLVVAIEAVYAGVTCMEVDFHRWGLKGAAFDAVVQGKELEIDAGIVISV